MCALSATDEFLDKCLEAFSGKSLRRRQQEPGPYLFLMLDRASSAPDVRKSLGIAMLQWKTVSLWDHVLVMHAKVALLSFGRSINGPGELLRLVVTTANWTEESAKRQVELVWTLDLDLLSPADAMWQQGATDMAAAKLFFESLLQMYHQQPFKDSISAVLDRVPAMKKKNQNVSRFISTLGIKSSTLLNQFCERISPAKRNYIICGSGFFEQAKERNTEPPDLLVMLLKLLRTNNKFSGTRKNNRILLVNPDQCGQVAEWLRDTEEQECEWRVLKSEDMSGEERTLHAKFIFLGTRKNDSLSNGFLYLGSGNLSLTGFNSAPTLRAKGNIEAGVCFDATVINSADDVLINKLLPWGKGLDFTDFPDSKHESEEFPGNKIIPPSPIACFRTETDGTYRVEWLEKRDCYVVEGVNSIAVPVDQSLLRLPSTLANVTHIIIRADNSEWIVPVLDARGGIPAKPLCALTFEELLEELDGFGDQCPDVDDPPDEYPDPPEPDPTGSPYGGKTTGFSRNFPAHSAMILVERISVKNQSVAAHRIDDWGEHLCRYFSEAIPKELKASWCGLQVNFLSVLKRRHFAPPSLNGDVALVGLWNTRVDDLSRILGVDAFPQIDEGVTDEC